MSFDTLTNSQSILKYPALQLQNCRRLLLCFTSPGKYQVTTKTETHIKGNRCSHFVFPSPTRQSTITENRKQIKEWNPTGSYLLPKSLYEEGSPRQRDLWLRLVRSPQSSFFPWDAANSPIFIKGSINKTENVKRFSEFWW